MSYLAYVAIVVYYSITPSFEVSASAVVLAVEVLAIAFEVAFN